MKSNGIPSRKANVYVYRTLPHKCPFCNAPLSRAEYIGKNNKVMKADLATCSKCKKNCVSAWFYYKNKNKLNSLNSEQANTYVNEIIEQNKQRKALKEALYNKVITEKIEVFEKVLPAFYPVFGFDVDVFRKAWLQSSVEADTLIVALIIKETSYKKKKGKYMCVFISDSNNVEKLHKTADSGFCIVNSHNLIANRAIASVKAGYMYFLIKGQRYNVCKTVVLSEDKFKDLVRRTVSYDEYYRIRTPMKKLNKPEITNDVMPSKREHDNDEDCYVYVYFTLTNNCMKKKHEIESVTAKTTDIKTGRPIDVNVFYCDRCDKYFINYEALQRYISRGIYPALRYIFDNFDDNRLNDASELMLYGYNVAEGCLSLYERRHILEWIIDSGLMSKAEIIRNLQFKVRFNGSKAGNKRARQKWLDDIQYVSRYVCGNSREIKAVFVFNKTKK